MTTVLRRVAAFLVRDLRIEASYRLAFVLQASGLAWMLVLFWFLSLLVGTDVPALAPYGGDFFTFVVLGYAPLEYLRVGILGFSNRVREAQTQGTLEALLVTRAGLPTIVFGSVAYPYLLSTVRAVLFVTLGITAGGAPAQVNVTALVAFLLLSIVAFAAIGLLSASFVMVFKKGDPIAMVLFGSSTLLSGLLFPTALLGSWSWIAKALPLTYAMEGVRLATRGSSLSDLRHEAGVLLAFCVVLVPLAGWCFRHALDAARRDGTLGQH